MTCRALRLIMYGFVGASIAGSAAVVRAGELTPGQFQYQAITIPKRIDLAAKPSDRLQLQPTDASLSGPPVPAQTPLSSPLMPLTGLSLDHLSLSARSTDSRASDDAKPAVTQQNGNIRYSVLPDAGFTPFVGIGAGRATGLLNAGLSHPAPYDTDDALHSYQGVAGFAYKLDKDTSLDFDYRMSNTQRPNVPMLDNANIADQGRDRAAMFSLHYSLDPVLRRPPE